MLDSDLPFCGITELQAFIFQVKDPIVNISSFSHCVLTGLQQKPLITGLWSAGGQDFAIDRSSSPATITRNPKFI